MVGSTPPSVNISPTRLPSKELAVSAAKRRAEEDAPADVIVHAEDGPDEQELTV
jgi:hypothetical protein